MLVGSCCFCHVLHEARYQCRASRGIVQEYRPTGHPFFCVGEAFAVEQQAHRHVPAKTKRARLPLAFGVAYHSSRMLSSGTYAFSTVTQHFLLVLTASNPHLAKWLAREYLIRFPRVAADRLTASNPQAQGMFSCHRRNILIERCVVPISLASSLTEFPRRYISIDTITIL